MYCNILLNNFSDSGMDIWTFNNTEYQDGISKIGALIIRDRLHYHNRKVH